MKAEPIVPVRVYLLVFLTLLVLTAITTAVAFFDLGGGVNNAIALTIAVCQGLLVILFFMHVRYRDKLTAVLAAAGFLWLLMLSGETLDDTMAMPATRHPT